jgi:hypothetical protein
MDNIIQFLLIIKPTKHYERVWATSQLMGRRWDGGENIKIHEKGLEWTEV